MTDREEHEDSLLDVFQDDSDSLGFGVEAVPKGLFAGFGTVYGFAQ